MVLILYWHLGFHLQERVLYTSYETGTPQIYVIEVSAKRTVLKNPKGTMSFAPRFSPDGQSVVYSLEQGGNTDIYVMNLRNSARLTLTSAPSIETAPVSPQTDPKLYLRVIDPERNSCM